ncbi:MAG: DUF2868 domain-containing protein [Betaproteobacteria bacterium]
MSLDENAALEVTAVRAIEEAALAKTVWNDGDSAWASRAAAEVVGEAGAPEDFLAARARLALGRIGERSSTFARAVNALRWRSWVGPMIIAAAFLAGLAMDEIGGSQRINLLAPPFFGLLLWNIIVYALLMSGFVVRYGEAADFGPLRRLVIRFAGGHASPGRGEVAQAIAQFAGEWSVVSAPLYGARVARLLHLAAASFAVGLIAGLYARGIAFEYQVTWESTFLGAESVHTLLAAALAPGAAISGIPIPTLAEVAAIRAPSGENAARWLHLMAGTVAVVVIAPRLALALSAWLLERYRRTHLTLSLDEPYFARLLRAFRGRPARVQVAPYSYALPPGASLGLERLIRRVVGANTSLTLNASVVYGSDDANVTNGRSDATAIVIALFNATATPERETHGAFLGALARHLEPGSTLVALIDEGAFRAHSRDEPARVEARRASWRALCSDRNVPCAFVVLDASDVAAAALELERAFEKAL